MILIVAGGSVGQFIANDENAQKLPSEVFQYLRKEVLKLGGKAYKWSSPGNKAVPDRICLFPLHRVYFVELKATDKTFSPLQAKVAKSTKVCVIRTANFDASRKFIIRHLYSGGSNKAKIRTNKLTISKFTM